MALRLVFSFFSPQGLFQPSDLRPVQRAASRPFRTLGCTDIHSELGELVGFVGGFVHHHLKSYIQKSFGNVFFSESQGKNFEKRGPVAFLVGPLCRFRRGRFGAAGNKHETLVYSRRSTYEFAVPLKRMRFETDKTRNPATKRLFWLTKKTDIRTLPFV